jgi:hypothetical protein
MRTAATLLLFMGISFSHIIITSLGIKANVKIPIYVSSDTVLLYGEEGQRVRKEVFIRAGLDDPLRLEHYQFDLSDEVAYVIEELEKGRFYGIQFTSNLNVVKNYHGSLRLKTNYTKKPEITIKIGGGSTNFEEQQILAMSFHSIW